MSSSVFAIPSAEERCHELADADKWNFALSLFIVVGILVSYLPQHLRIILRGSSEGLSPWFVLLGTVSGTSAIFNIFLLPTSTIDIRCCSVNSSFSCAAGLLGIAQVSVQWLCFFAVMLLFLIYFPKDVPEVNEDSLDEDSGTPRYRDALTVAAISFLHFFILIILSIVFYALHLLGPWANFLGIMSALLACVQYFPQIYTTYKLGEVKSLSVPMMCIQTPGSYVFAMSLYLRLGWPGWSAWGVYVITGALQGVLLGMGLQFLFRDWKVNKALEEETRRNTFINGRRSSADYDASLPSEQTPLLPEYSDGDDSNGHASNGDSTRSRKGHGTITKSKLSIVHNAED